jgi:hypothetical protein
VVIDQNSRCATDAALARPLSSLVALPTPRTRRRILVPGGDRVLQPGGDLLGVLGMLARKGSTHNSTSMDSGPTQHRLALVRPSATAAAQRFPHDRC